MRRALVATAVLGALALQAAVYPARARADDLPPGTLGFVFGVMSGTGADAKRLGYGFYQFGMQAAWQPTSTERAIGLTFRWATMFGTLYNGTAAEIDSQLHTVNLDFTAGLRFRPWNTPTRYLTARVGGEFLRSNEPIPPLMHRSFIGGIASVGLDQYFGGFMLNVDVRYGLIAPDAPRSLALLVGVGLAGP